MKKLDCTKLATIACEDEGSCNQTAIAEVGGIGDAVAAMRAHPGVPGV